MIEEARLYYYIDRKLVSNDFIEVVDGLRELKQFLKELNSTQILNSVAMRLMDLYNTAKISYIKIQASHLIKEFEQMIQQLPNKEQIVAILYNSLKSLDKLTRIMAIQTIKGASSLFHKQNSVYHLLLSKLREGQQISLKQKMRAIQCLSALLHQSEHLSRLFSNNITELIQIGGINLKFILYLCIYANFQTHQYPLIVKTVWKKVHPLLEVRKIKSLFSHFLKKACRNNLTCFNQCNKFLITYFPELKNQLNILQLTKYNFMEKECDLTNQISNQVILDLCYEYKTRNITECLKGVVKECEKRIKQAIERKSIDDKILLLTFYVEKSYDDLLIGTLKENNLKMLKIALVTSNYGLAEHIIDYFMDNWTFKMQAMVLLKSYVTLKLEQNQENCVIFLQILDNVAHTSRQPNLQRLALKWEKQCLGTASVVNSVEQQANNTNIECKQELDSQNHFIEFMPAKQVQRAGKFRAVYFGKRTILDLLRYL